MILNDRDQFSESITTDTDSFTSAAINNTLSAVSSAVEVHFIIYSLANLQAVSENVNFTEVLLEKKSELNKQSHVEEVTSLTVSLISQPSVSSTAFQSEMFTEQDFFFQSVSVQNKNEHSKKKSQKCTEKTVIIVSLIDLIDKNTEFVNKSISV